MDVEATRGDMEKEEPVSETRLGAPSMESALDTSETEGDGSGISEVLLESYEALMDKGLWACSAGRAKESCSLFSSKS